MVVSPKIYAPAALAYDCPHSLNDTIIEGPARFVIAEENGEQWTSEPVDSPTYGDAFEALRARRLAAPSYFGTYFKGVDQYKRDGEAIAAIAAARVMLNWGLEQLADAA